MALILGVDEAGRGPIAGPVAVGVVAVDERLDLLELFPGLNDSKKLSEKKREELFTLLENVVQKGEMQFHVSFVSAKDIDEKGITHAVRTGVHEGVRKLMPNARDGRVMLDGLLHGPEEYEQETVIHGDALVPAIMLASVAAKVTRDRFMCGIATKFPAYNFERHKGYGTSAHYDALALHGLCLEHRRSYLKSFTGTNSDHILKS